MTWKKENLADVAEIVMGQSPDSIFYNSENVGMPFLQGCAEFGKQFPQSQIFSSQIKKVGKRNSILFSVRAPVGKINLADKNYCIGRGLSAITGKKINQSYLLQFFNFAKDSGGFSSQGSTFESINSDELGKIKVSFPEEETEQKRIAEILSTADEAIEQTQALIDKYNRIKRGLMQDLLTRGIDQNGNIRSKQTHKFTVKNGIEVPDDWDVVRLGNVCSKIQDGTHFSPKTNKHGDFKYVTSKNIRFGYLDLSNLEFLDKKEHDDIYRHCAVKFGDVLLTKDGANTGNACLNSLNEEFSLLSSVCILRGIENRLSNAFLLNIILSEKGQRLIKDSMSGLAITRVTLNIINSFEIVLPSIEEQDRINGKLKATDDWINSIKENLNKLQAIKKGLMQDLLSGKVRVKIENAR